MNSEHCARDLECMCSFTYDVVTVQLHYFVFINFSGPMFDSLGARKIFPNNSELHTNLCIIDGTFCKLKVFCLFNLMNSIA